MSVDLTAIERRLAALETTVSDLQRRLGMNATAPNWLEQISGIVKDVPGFEEALQYGREFRYADRPQDDEPQGPTS